MFNESPEPAGIVAPVSSDVLSTGATEGQETIERTEFILPQPIAEWIEAAAQYASTRLEPVSPAIMVKQLQAVAREMREAVMLRAQGEVVSLSIVGGAMLLHLFLVSTPFYVEGGESGGEEEAQAETEAPPA